MGVAEPGICGLVVRASTGPAPTRWTPASAQVGRLGSRFARPRKKIHLITTFLLNHAAAVPVGFWIVVAVSAALGWALFHFGRRRALLILAGIGLLAALALTMSPSGGGAGIRCTVQFSVPFEGIDTLANVAMLLPLTLFAALALRRPLAVLTSVSGFSALIEVVQAVVPVLGRACDTNDWFMNTVGAALGALLAVAILAIETRRRRPGRATRVRT